MVRKIILFLSDFKKDASEKEYICPDCSVVAGSQTNDAPVRYLLNTYPEVSEIICIVTSLAKETALEHFEAVVRGISPEIQLTSVSYEEDQDFSVAAIPNILRHVDENDEILLDVTGGFRNANMHLLLLSRVLSYNRVKAAGAVYSNLKTSTVEDVSHLIDLFELVGGMQEMTSFGSVTTLRAYYDKLYRSGRQKDEKILNLLTAVERLTETITMCRTSAIDDRLEKFNEAIEDAETCSDPLMKTLLPVFRKKYGRKLTTPGLINWCVENGMVQQALTLYKERIPTYLMRDRKDLIEPKPGIPPVEKRNVYANDDEALFYERLLKLGYNKRAYLRRKNADVWFAEEGRDPAVITLEHLDGEMLADCDFVVRCSTDKLRKILSDYVYIRALRNMIHHASDAAVDKQKDVEKYLTEREYKKLEDVGLDDVKKALLQGLEHMKNAERKGKKK